MHKLNDVSQLLSYHVDTGVQIAGVPGWYSSTRNGSFVRVHHHSETGISCIGSVPVGNYGSDGIRPHTNPDIKKDIVAKVAAHAKMQLIA